MKTKAIFFAIATFCFMNILVAQHAKFTASINGKSSGVVKKSDIIGQLIKVSNDQYRVVSYVFILRNDQSNIRIAEQSDQITKRCSNHIRTAPSGTIIIIEDIEAQNAQGQKIKLPSLNFTLE